MECAFSSLHRKTNNRTLVYDHKNAGGRIYSTELILSGVVTQKLEYERSDPLVSLFYHFGMLTERYNVHRHVNHLTIFDMFHHLYKTRSLCIYHY